MDFSVNVQDKGGWGGGEEGGVSRLLRGGRGQSDSLSEGGGTNNPSTRK